MKGDYLSLKVYKSVSNPKLIIALIIIVNINQIQPIPLTSISYLKLVLNCPFEFVHFPLPEFVPVYFDWLCYFDLPYLAWLCQLVLPVECYLQVPELLPIRMVMLKCHNTGCKYYHNFLFIFIIISPIQLRL